MSRPKALKIEHFRADYAKTPDYCEVFEREMKPLYLLAFLLTANHQEAEECFAATIEMGCEEKCVFKDWTESWIKRCLIQKAIHTVFSRSARDRQRSLWGGDSCETRLRDMVNAVTDLEVLERFVFVMSILEAYSVRECSLLLHCRGENIVQLRMRASTTLAASNSRFSEPLAVQADQPESN